MALNKLKNLPANRSQICRWIIGRFQGVFLSRTNLRTAY